MEECDRMLAHVSDANGNEAVKTDTQRLHHMSELEEINEDLKKENKQLRAQLLEQDEIMTREFRRRLEDSGIHIRSRVGSTAPPQECFQKHGILRSPEGDVNHGQEKHDDYKSQYEEAQEELCKALTQTATLQEQYQQAKGSLLKLEKIVEANQSEIEGLQQELCNVSDEKESAEIMFRVEKKKTIDLTSRLATAEDEVRTMAEEREVEIQAERDKNYELMSQISSIVQETDMEQLEKDLAEANSKLDSCREELVDKIDLIAQLEEQAENSFPKSDESEMLRKVEDENVQLRKDIQSLRDILSRPEHSTKNALTELKLELARSNQESSDLRRHNIVLLNRERDQMRLLKEMEDEKKGLLNDLNSVKGQVYYDEASANDTNSLTSRHTMSSILESIADADSYLSNEYLNANRDHVSDASISPRSITKRPYFSETSMTNETNSLTSSLPNDREVFSPTESSISFDMDSIDYAAGEAALCQDTPSTTTPCLEGNQNYDIIEESDDTSSGANEEKSQETEEIVQVDDGAGGAVAELLQLPSLQDSVEEETSATDTSEPTNETVNLGVWLTNSMAQFNSPKVDPKTSKSLATKSTFTATSSEDSEHDRSAKVLFL